jgi:hypothetical protein
MLKQRVSRPVAAKALACALRVVPTALTPTPSTTRPRTGSARFTAEVARLPAGASTRGRRKRCERDAPSLRATPPLLLSSDAPLRLLRAEQRPAATAVG